jgi:hypothetical protein
MIPKSEQPFWSGPDKTVRIMRRVLCDCVSGLLAAFSVSPIIMTVDKAVIESVSGSKTLWKSVQGTIVLMAKSPIRFVFSREFMWVFFVSGSTYMTANSIDSLCKISHTSDAIPKLVFVTAVNIAASLKKDRAFAYYFGKKVSNKVGSISLLLWLLRDVLNMAAAFVIPQRASKYFQNQGISKEKAERVSLFAFPVVFQFFLTPIHMLGFDFFNFHERKMKERIKYLRPTYLSTVGIRMIKMGGSYGIGGMNNKRFRNYFVSRFEGPAWDSSY